MAQLTAKSFELIEREGPKTVDVYDMFERWTLDVLGRTGFGKTIQCHIDYGS